MPINLISEDSHINGTVSGPLNDQGVFVRLFSRLSGGRINTLEQTAPFLFGIACVFFIIAIVWYFTSQPPVFTPEEHWNTQKYHQK